MGRPTKQTTKTFPLPSRPKSGEQHITVEQIGGIWHLVIDKDRAKPLPTLRRMPQTAKEVLDALAAVSGLKAVRDFADDGYSQD